MSAACAASISSVQCNAISSRAASWQTTRNNYSPTPLSGMSFKGSPTSRTRSRKLQVVAVARHYLVDKVSGAQLHKLLTERKFPIVVDFYATWCGPCILCAQLVERLAVEYGHYVRFVKIDTDEEYELANKMQIRGLPTILFVSKDTGKDVIRTEGLLPRDTLRNIIENDL